MSLRRLSVKKSSLADKIIDRCERVTKRGRCRGLATVDVDGLGTRWCHRCTGSVDALIRRVEAKCIAAMKAEAEAKARRKA